MFEKPFTLSPHAGDRLKAALDAAHDANLSLALTGHDVIETSQGRNLTAALVHGNLKRVLAAEYGAAAITRAPGTQGLSVRVPACTVLLGGDAFLVAGSEADGSQLLDFTNLPPGAYAVVLESWLALVGPTTQGRATEPAIFSGVTDATAKPSATTLFPAGNADRTADGVSDAALVTATVVTQKFVQRQYRLRVLQDRNLIGYASDATLGLPYAASARLGPDVVEAVLPDTQDGYAKALDRRVHAMKLCVVEHNGSLLTLHVNDFRVADAYQPRGQRPVPLRLTRAAFAQWAHERMTVLATQIDAAQASILALQSEFTHCDLSTITNLQVLTSGLDGALPQRLAFTRENSDDQSWHTDAGIPSRVTVNFTGRVHVTASVQFTPSDNATGARVIRLLVDGQRTAFAQSAAPVANLPTLLNLSAEVSVRAGQYLELEAWQNSGTTLTVAAGAAFTVRRTQ